MRIGVCIPISERGSERRVLSFVRMRELALLTEHGGLDSIWVADHLLFRGADDQVRGAWEAVSMLGALAEATSRVELGPLVLCTPFRNPGVIAWIANTLDEISQGRFVLGLGSGWHQPEFDAFGFEFNRRVSVFADALEVLVPLLRDGDVDYDGRWARGHAELHPLPKRPTGPPILIAGSKPRMMGLIARWADRWNSVWYGLPTDEFRDERGDLVAACEAIGRDPGTIEVSVGIVIKDPRTIDRNDGDAIVGKTEDIADAFAAWSKEGVTEVMCRLEPPSTGVVETIADAARTFRAAGAAIR